ncbi:EAL domain-containing protein [Sulfurimonas sp. C5]|uniref:EAL domain-containing protein n=1 Tax=Sulfurimonas sp. C5 TaxID=3036947 RepID=UPI002453D9F9|nr:EAL domain-containing protein [Sulfurimonas sp. C5]MDH4943456.1 EAL domain-containing protein [Sulfurimonas sp. C5]
MLNKHNISIITFIKFILPFALFWSLANVFFGQILAASITLIYVFISLSSLLLYKRTRNETLLVRIQMVLILLLPFLMMWTLGGFENGSNTMIWAFLAPIMALLYTNNKEPFYWLVAFLVLLSISVAIEPILTKQMLHYSLKEILFLINTAAVLSGIYILLKYFISQTKDDVNNNISFLQSYKTTIDTNLIVTKTDFDGKITFANENFYKISQYNANETLGAKHNLVRHPDTDPKVYTEIWDTILNKKTWHGQLKNRAKDGSTYWVETAISPILDKDNNIVEFIAIRYNITELIQKQETLTNLLYTDTLTGLKNRKALFKDKSSNKRFSLVLINIDNFSQINNLYGETFGDKVLLEFSSFLHSAVQQKETCELYRLAGDEFVILSEERDPEFLQQNIKGIIQYLHDNPISIDDQEVILSISVGISLEENNALLETSSMALKFAKRNSKHIAIYSEDISLNKEYENNLKWVKEIKSAIKHDRVVLYYQAIKDNKNGNINKYETLMRLLNTEGEVISPANFLDIAKKSKLYKELTKIVITKSFEYFKDKDYNFSVNITIEDILSPEINQFIIDSLEKYQIGPKVSFEIVESENIEKFAVIEKFISTVKSYGAKISIDDFGTGYSNFEYLMRLQADYIKIDGSIIKNIVHDKKSALITSIIVAFAQQMHIKTIGEFVENKDIEQKLKELGVDKSQGYFIEKPKEKL